MNGEGQTYAVVHGPKEFTLGSPATESGRYGDEMAHRERIECSFAIATKEVTVEQFLRFRPGRVIVSERYPLQNPSYGLLSAHDRVRGWSTGD